MMSKVLTVLGIVFALFIAWGGVQHFMNPQFYYPFVPEVLPFPLAIIYVSGALEVLFGVAYLVPKFRHIGAWGIFFLMLIFLPIHVLDIFIDAPAIGSKTAAYIRLAVQFLFIGLAWLMIKTSKTTVV